MKKTLGLSMVAFIVILASFQISVSSCQKEQDTPVVYVRDTIPVVNAGRDTTIQLISANAEITVSGTATDANGIIVGYLWSQVSGPSTVVFKNNGAPTTRVSNLTEGDYVFQLMATDDDGATGVKSVRITIRLPQLFEKAFQPANNPNEVLLVYTVSGGIDGTNPSAHQLDADAWTNGGSMMYVRGLFRFDLSTIPATAKIISAKLTLYSTTNPVNGNLINANFGSDNTMLIQRVTSSWSNTVRWLNQPTADASSQIVVPHTTLSNLDLTDVDVTGMVQTMVQTNNYGWMIKLQNEVYYNSRQFYSSKSANTPRHPKLVVVYQ